MVKEKILSLLKKEKGPELYDGAMGEIIDETGSDASKAFWNKT